MLVATGSIIYLNRAYAHIYNFIGAKNLSQPSMEQEFHFSGAVKTEKTTVRYAALGDSLTAGVGAVDVKNSFPYLIADKLSAKSNVELLNLGEPGAVTNDVVKNQLDKAITFQPNLVTVLIGINDIHNRVSLADFKISFNKTISSLTLKTKARIIIINIPLLGTTDLLLPPFRLYFNNQTKKFNAAIKEIAAANNVCIVNLYNQTKNQFSKDLSVYAADHFHPSDDGYRLWSQIIYANSNCRPD